MFTAADKSEIMTHAWYEFRLSAKLAAHGIIGRAKSFGDALRAAWKYVRQLVAQRADARRLRETLATADPIALARHEVACIEMADNPNPGERARAAEILDRLRRVQGNQFAI
ncbi:MAG: hypothetical protein AAF311_07210 [Pseudomonadota bacterium]